jgi:hypothetical protein
VTVPPETRTKGGATRTWTCNEKNVFIRMITILVGNKITTEAGSKKSITTRYKRKYRPRLSYRAHSLVDKSTDQSPITPTNYEDPFLQ